MCHIACKIREMWSKVVVWFFLLADIWLCSQFVFDIWFALTLPFLDWYKNLKFRNRVNRDFHLVLFIYCGSQHICTWWLRLGRKGETGAETKSLDYFTRKNSANTHPNLTVDKQFLRISVLRPVRPIARAAERFCVFEYLWFYIPNIACNTNRIDMAQIANNGITWPEADPTIHQRQ